MRKEPKTETGPKVRESTAERTRPKVLQAAAKGQRNEGSRSAQPYVPMPEPTQRKPGFGRRKLAVLLVTAMAIAGGALLVSRRFVRHATAPVAADQERVFHVSSADIDVEATAIARQIISSEQISDTSAEREKDQAAQFLSTPHGPPASKATPLSIAGARPAASSNEAKKKLVRTVLSHATPAVRREIAEGKQSIFTLHLLDDEVEDGDAVVLYVNGVSYGRVDLTNRGQEVLVTIPIGALSQMRVLAVQDGGGGGVTFGATSSIGDIRSKVMDVGDSDNWTVVPR